MLKNKNKRGPKLKPESEKKVPVTLWVKKKYKELAEIDLACLQVKYENTEEMDKELKRFNA